MAFQLPQPDLPPVRVKGLRLVLDREIEIVTNPVTLEQTEQVREDANFFVNFLDENGMIATKVVRGSAIPHLTPQQIAQLRAFMADLFAQAEGEFFPE